MQPIKHATTINRTKNWRDVAGYEGLYKVSSDGEVSTTRRQGTTGENLKPVLQPHGYLTVMLCKHGKRHKEYVHRLVANSFLGEHPQMVVNHKDEDKQNNAIENLEWVTNEENLDYGNALYKNAVARRMGRAKYVVQLDLGGNEVARYRFLKDAAASVNGVPINISRAARHIMNRVVAYGYKWRYE